MPFVDQKKVAYVKVRTRLEWDMAGDLALAIGPDFAACGRRKWSLLDHAEDFGGWHDRLSLYSLGWFSGM